MIVILISVYTYLRWLYICFSYSYRSSYSGCGFGDVEYIQISNVVHINFSELAHALFGRINASPNFLCDHLHRH